MIDLSVIIINYNTFDLTCNCIFSVTEHTKNIRYEIILVDNASTECDAGLFVKKFPQVKLIKNPVNSGFAKGNNLGIDRAGGNYILLLNSDTVFKNNAAEIVFDFLKHNESYGIGTAQLQYPDGTI